MKIAPLNVDNQISWTANKKPLQIKMIILLITSSVIIANFVPFSVSHYIPFRQRTH